MTRWAVWGLMLLGAAAPVVEEPAMTAEAFMVRMDEMFRTKGSRTRMEIRVTGPRTSRSLTVQAWSQGEDKSLVVVEAPAREAGIATLRIGDNLWNYMPKIARTVRVPPSMMLGSWMGTDFTNDDLVKESSYKKDFVSSWQGRGKGPGEWVLVSAVRPGVVGRWTRIETLVDEREWLPKAMKYFDRKGRLARVMTFTDVQSLGGRRLPTRMILVPADLERQRTEMRYLDAAFDLEIPDDQFNLTQLEKKR